MAFPTISVINFTRDLTDRKVQEAIRAVNRQITEDFAPVWGAIWDLRLHASPFDLAEPDTVAEDPVQGEAVLYLVDEPHLPGAAGYHARNNAEKPYGFVFITDPKDWTVTLSHEALELIIDPTVNVLVPGPDPRPGQSDNQVLHAYEVCDAVERTSYEIDGIRVSNFITQNWFVSGEAAGTRNDFLGVGVGSFGATTGSHLAFFDLNARSWVLFFGEARELSRACAVRQAEFEHDRPRPEEEPLMKLLNQLKADPPPFLRDLPRERLQIFDGVTRTGRREAAQNRPGRGGRGVGKSR
ncbi:MAG: hypothetical protein IH827_04255 [Myxococcales bacterium]|nr:hypothetical protein [Myxococcales bacterium]